MPRKPPARVRAQAPFRHPVSGISAVPGLSARGRWTVERLERTRWSPGDVSRMLRQWTDFVRAPDHRIWDHDHPGCGVEECCPDYRILRDRLDLVLALLPPRDAKRVRRRMALVDDSW
jgi:hypothetical protein